MLREYGFQCIARRTGKALYLIVLFAATCCNVQQSCTVPGAVWLDVVGLLSKGWYVHLFSTSKCPQRREFRAARGSNSLKTCQTHREDQKTKLSVLARSGLMTPCRHRCGQAVFEDSISAALNSMDLTHKTVQSLSKPFSLQLLPCCPPPSILARANRAQSGCKKSYFEIASSKPSATTCWLHAGQKHVCTSLVGYPMNFRA